MLLAIDVGNTNSKFVVFDGDRIVDAGLGRVGCDEAEDKVLDARGHRDCVHVDDGVAGGVDVRRKQLRCGDGAG